MVSDKVFADDTDHVKDFKYFKSFKQFDEVSKVLLKKSVGRASEQERILVSTLRPTSRKQQTTARITVPETSKSPCSPVLVHQLPTRT